MTLLKKFMFTDLQFVMVHLNCIILLTFQQSVDYLSLIYKNKKNSNGNNG